MTETLESSFFTTMIQAVGIMLVAGLLLPMTRALPGLFLRYWTFGWVALTVALFSVFASFQADQKYRELFLIGYCEGEYLFGFLLWAGCREATTGQALRPMHFLALVPPAIFGVIAPLLLHDIHYLFPFHAALVGSLVLFAFLAVRRFPRRPFTPSTGLWLLRGSLLALGLLFLHYGAVTGYLVYVRPDLMFRYMAFNSLYDLLLETCLAFGMVLLTTDRLRGELTEKNSQLAAATVELAIAARTDALTGLLNRRAFDDLSKEPSAADSAGGIAVLDMNDLKPLNDRFGHTAGDVALQLVARALRVHFRVTDPIFRLGGDEFAVVMPDCTESELATRLLQVDKALVEQRIPSVPGTIDLLIAWGVTSYANPSDIADALRKADLAMYACKRERKSLKPAASLPDGPHVSMGGL